MNIIFIEMKEENELQFQMSQGGGDKHGTSDLYYIATRLTTLSVGLISFVSQFPKSVIVINLLVSKSSVCR